MSIIKSGWYHFRFYDRKVHYFTKKDSMLPRALCGVYFNSKFCVPINKSSSAHKKSSKNFCEECANKLKDLETFNERFIEEELSNG